MANFNKVILLGNLTRDVELRYTQGGLAVAKFGMAVNRRSSNKDGETRESTCFVDMTAFGKQAEVLDQYVGKGSQLFTEGRLDFSTWEDKNGGGKRSKLEVIVENFQFVGSRGDGQKGDRGGSEKAASTGGGGDAASADFDDIPF
ncbi:MAG: single-stranded DNA-binding protein [Planctomycetota bacterium]|nr:single-stranded DNA-binding protein [Planctomycetota bacterium]